MGYLTSDVYFYGLVSIKTKALVCISYFDYFDKFNESSLREKKSNNFLGSISPSLWTVISSLLTPTELGHGTSTSGWIYSSNLYMSLMCYSLYDAVIVRARSSRTEGSQ